MLPSPHHHQESGGQTAHSPRLSQGKNHKDDTHQTRTARSGQNESRSRKVTSTHLRTRERSLDDAVSMTRHRDQIERKAPAAPQADLRKKLEELQIRLDNMDNKDGQATYKYSMPFTDEIMNEPLPRRWHTPQFDSYNGTTDPWEHLDAYRSKMCLQGASDAILCRGFPGTLKGVASDWFRSFRKGDIENFDQLVGLFLYKFGNQKRIPKTRTHLLALKQKTEETLMDYVDRFKKETINIVGVTEDMQVMAFQHGVKSGKFSFDLNLNPPKTMNELYARAEKYYLADEQERKKRGEGERNDGRKRKDGGRDEVTDTSQKRGRVQDRLSIPLPRKRSPDLPRIYTPLNTPPATILAVVEKEPYVRWPSPMRSNPEMRNRNKWCYFHKDHGHTTNECYQLRNVLEGLIQRGYLGQYVERDARPRSPRRGGDRDWKDQGLPRQEEVAQVAHQGRLVINTVAGGLAGGNTISPAS